MSEGKLKKQLKELVQTSAEINLQFAVMDGRITHEQANIFEHQIEIKNAYLDRILDVAKREFPNFYNILQHFKEGHSWIPEDFPAKEYSRDVIFWFLEYFCEQPKGLKHGNSNV